MHLLDSLLARYRFARALTRSGVRPCPLPANRQSATVPQPPITPNVTQPGYALLQLASQGTLDGVVLIDDSGDAAELVFSQLAGPQILIYSGFLADLLSMMRPNPEDVLQRYHKPLLVRNLDTCYTWHILPPANPARPA
jgi:hypothetical protein